VKQALHLPSDLRA